MWVRGMECGCWLRRRTRGCGETAEERDLLDRTEGGKEANTYIYSVLRWELAHIWCLSPCDDALPVLPCALSTVPLLYPTLSLPWYSRLGVLEFTCSPELIIWELALYE